MIWLRASLNTLAGFLLRGVTGKLLYVIALHLDALVSIARAALWMRFPGLYSFETLPLHQRARRIRQGIGESDAAYADRLTRYLEAHDTWGGPYALLDQIWHHYKDSPGGPYVVHLFYQSGAYFQLHLDGTVARLDVITSTGVPAWANWWLVYEWPSIVDDDGLWDDGTAAWDEPADAAWDTTLPFSTCQDIRLIPTEWNNGHCIGRVILLGPGEAVWDVPDEDWNSEEEWDAGGDSDLVEFSVY